VIQLLTWTPSNKPQGKSVLPPLTSDLEHFSWHISLSHRKNIIPKTPIILPPVGFSNAKQNSSQCRQRKLCGLLSIIFNSSLPEEQVKDMADLIGAATSIEQVEKTVQSLPSFNFPSDLVIARISAILALCKHDKQTLPDFL
jgi:hypothetical protein